MVAIVSTVAYLGLEARAVEVQVQLASGLPRFTIVGLPDNAVRESRERVRAAMASIGLALPPKVITINLSPADLPKEGSHFDLPIALGLLAAIGATDSEGLSHYVAVGELSLDGRIAASPGVLLAALHASGEGKGLICPVGQGVQRVALPGPLTMRTRPSQQVWLPSHGWPALRQEGAASVPARLPNTPAANAVAPARKPRRLPGRARARAMSSNLELSIIAPLS